jgi:hypothetical protein
MPRLILEATSFLAAFTLDEERNEGAFPLADNLIMSGKNLSLALPTTHVSVGESVDLLHTLPQ